jgi:hypothetical protein
MMLTRFALAAVTVIALTAAAAAKPVTLSVETNLRNAPGTKSEIVTLIPKGAAIEVGECDAGWCKVTYNDREGFAVERNLGAAPRPSAPRQADLHRLRQGYEDQFGDQAAGQSGPQGDYRAQQNYGAPAQGNYRAQGAPPAQGYPSTGRAPQQRYAEEDYYDDDAPVYAGPGYVAVPPPVYYGYYPYARRYWGYGYGPYWRRW